MMHDNDAVKHLNCNKVDSTKLGTCFLYKLPDELISRIFTYVASSTYQLGTLEQVSKRCFRLVQNQKLWFLAFRYEYPTWTKNVIYSKGLIDWKGYLLHLVKQRKTTKQFSFKFINEEEKQKAEELDFNSLRWRKRKYGQIAEDDSEEQDMGAVDGNADRQRRRRPILSSRPAAVVDDTAEDGPSLRRPADILSASLPRINTTVDPNDVSFNIQDPLVVDIDRVTKTGVVATGKHRRRNHQSEHLILFWAYPSWKLIRKFEMNLVPSSLSCQIIGIQSVRLPNKKKVRLFSIAVGTPFIDQGPAEDRVDIWSALFVYQLHEDGSTECLAHIKITDRFLGREVFLFSEASWKQLNDGDIDKTHEDDSSPTNDSPSKVKDWLRIISPEHVDYDPNYTMFVTAMGLVFNGIKGCIQLAKFDIRASQSENVLDPSKEPCIWNEEIRELVPMTDVSMFQFYHYFDRQSGLTRMRTNDTRNTIGSSSNSNINGRFFSSDRPTSIIKRIFLGEQVSCMIHFKYPPQLNHLICTGSYDEDELSVYDWRFGVKVGSLPWKTKNTTMTASNNSRISHNDNLRTTVPSTDQEQIPEMDDENETAPSDVTGHIELTSLVGEALDENMRHIIEEIEESALGEADIDMVEEVEEEEEDEHEGVDNINAAEVSDASPWGLESTFVIPGYWSSSASTPSIDTSTLADQGLRLIAVGDTRSDNPRSRLEIKIWDISYLLNVEWDPLKDDEINRINGRPLQREAANEKETDEDDGLKGLPRHIKAGVLNRFPWWPRRTKELARLAIRMVKSDAIRQEAIKMRRAIIRRIHLETIEANRPPVGPLRQARGTPPPLVFFEELLLEKEENNYRSVELPYSTSNEYQSLLLCHTFDKNEQPRDEQQQSSASYETTEDRATDIPVKYTAYNVLYTSLFLLTEDGKVTVMDIETGRVTGTVNNVAEGASEPNSRMSAIKRIHGIDVNVIGGREVVVTSKEGILRGLV